MDYKFSGIIVRYVAKDVGKQSFCAMANMSPQKVTNIERGESQCSVDAATNGVETGEKEANSSAPTSVLMLDGSPNQGHAFSASEDKNTTCAHGAADKDNKTDASKLKVSAVDELHVNLWEVGEEPFLDLGIMVGEWQKLSAIQVDLPWEVDRRDITDLGALLNSEKAVAAIFNEVVDYYGQADRSFADVALRRQGTIISDNLDNKASENFLLLRLNPTLFDVSTITLMDGSVTSRIRVSVPSDIEGRTEKAYFRFRIKSVPSEVYATKFKQADRSLLSSSSETRIVDFRINVRRGIPDEVMSSDRLVSFPRFKKIHFFLTAHRSEICEFQNQDFVGCRSLMDEAEWTQYITAKPGSAVSPEYLVRDYLGYQWSVKSGEKESSFVKDLNVLGRFSSNKTNVWQIVRFIFLGLIFGMTGNAVWDAVKPSKDPSIGLLARLADGFWDLFYIFILLIVALIISLPMKHYFLVMMRAAFKYKRSKSESLNKFKKRIR